MFIRLIFKIAYFLRLIENASLIGLMTSQFLPSQGFPNLRFFAEAIKHVQPWGRQFLQTARHRGKSRNEKETEKSNTEL